MVEIVKAESLPKSEAGLIGDIIVVDDDDSILHLLHETLKRRFTVHVASDAEQALALFGQDEPLALLTDEMMPGMSGIELLEQVKTLAPNTVRMLMTANHDVQRAVAAVNRGEIHRFFLKPLRPVEVSRVIADVVERAQSELLLRDELQALSAIRSTTVNTEVRVLALSHNAQATEALRAACHERDYTFSVEEQLEAGERAILSSQYDLLVLVDDGLFQPEQMLMLARQADEAMGVLLLDPEPSLERASAAYSLGMNDYLHPPWPQPAAFARRLERAVRGRVVGRDMRRVTSDLILANRDLAQARRRIEAEQVAVLRAMINALEARDAYTAGHTDRVAAISVGLGRVLGFAPERIRHIRVGALLHDIGKIGVRDDVLLKPGRLNAAEFEQIKLHTLVGDKLLKDIEQFKCVMSMIRGHHEKMDGTGYPDGLAGDHIPIEARVVAVADVMDAVTSNRPYRKGSDLERGLEIVRSMEGHHLDPNVVGALHQLHKEDRLQRLLQEQADAQD